MHIFQLIIYAFRAWLSALMLQPVRRNEARVDGLPTAPGAVRRLSLSAWRGVGCSATGVPAESWKMSLLGSLIGINLLLSIVC
jgi:hypothetical protein